MTPDVASSSGDRTDRSADVRKNPRTAIHILDSPPPDAIDLNARLLLRAILPILKGQLSDPYPNPRVQFAVDRLRVAACERAVRILASDLLQESA